MKSIFYFRIMIPALLFSIGGKLFGQDPSPAWTWAKSLSSTGNIFGNAIAIAPNGSNDIYVAGGFQGTTDFDPGPGTFYLASGSPQVVGIFVSKFDGSGNFLWAKAMVRVGVGAAFADAMAIDPVDGAIYTTGLIQGTIDFDPASTGTFNLTSVGNNDIFISKLDSEGNFVWARVLGGPQDDNGSSLVIDPGGNGDVYITGRFKETVDFDPDSTGTFNLSSVGTYDIFISKLNRSGHFLWTKAIGGEGSDVSRSIAFDPSGGGKVYTRGYFEKTADFDPGGDTYNLTAEVGQENFISKIDGAGNFLWAKEMGRMGSEFDSSIALDPAGSGDVYTTGSFQGSSDFDPGPDTYNLTSAGMSDFFISKLDSSGHFVWAKAMGGTNQDYGTAIAIQSGQCADIYVIGNFRGTVDFCPGPDICNIASTGGKDIFISKLDTSGNVQWGKAIKGTNDDYCRSIAINTNCLYLTGFFPSPSISFDSITLTNAITSVSVDDLFFANLNLNQECITSVSEIKQYQINMYPNPATNELTFELDGDEFFKGDITLFNILGELVYYSPAENIGQKKTIDISGLAKGIYFVELNIDGNRVVEKVVKE